MIRQGYNIYLRVVLDTGIKLDVMSPTIGDIGCGDGAFAVELAARHKSLSYIGFEVNEKWVKALNENFSALDFRFELMDLCHFRYNPKGVINATELRLPIDDETLDLVVVNSVFNHLSREVVERYLLELNRTLKPNGVVWIGFLLARELSDRYIRHDMSYEYEHEGYYSDGQGVGNNTLYPEDTFKQMVSGPGLVLESIRYGNWRDRKGKHMISDAAVLRKIKPE